MMGDGACELIVVRHGETQWNLEGRAQGHLDSPLTDLGRRQAEAVAGALAGEGIDAIYSSDLGRAVQTAGAIADRHGIGVVTDSRLRERHLGVWQGLTRAEFRGRHEAAYSRFVSGDVDYVIPGGESARGRHERAIGCLTELAGRHVGQCVVVVTHGGVCNSAFRHAVGLGLEADRRFSLLNASINRVVVSGDLWRLAVWGDVRHLAGMAVRDDL